MQTGALRPCLLVLVLVVAEAVLQASGQNNDAPERPCPPSWRQQTDTCYLADVTSEFSWAGANARCQEVDGSLVSITTRGKMLDVLDVLNGITTPSAKWWINVANTSTFDNYADAKAQQDPARRQCAYISTDDSFWYRAVCDSVQSYICERPAVRVSVDVVDPAVAHASAGRERPSAQWLATHGARLEAEWQQRENASQVNDDKGTYSERLATMTTMPLPTTTPMTTEAPATSPASSAATSAATTAGSTAAPCFGSWKSVGSFCYNVFTQPLNWTDSEEFCEDNGGHIIHFNSRQQQDAFTQAYALTGSIWLGLARDPDPLSTSHRMRLASILRAQQRRLQMSSTQRIHHMSNIQRIHPLLVNLGVVYSWPNGNRPTYDRWTSSRPNPRHRCAMLEMHLGEWRSANCSDTKAFACVRTPDATPRPRVPTPPTKAATPEPTACGGSGWWKFRNSCLLVVSSPPVSWHEALRRCYNQSATLVKIVDFANVASLFSKPNNTPRADTAWIGLTKLGGQYHWTDGSQMELGLSLNRGSDHDMASCVEVNLQGGLTSTNCNAPRPYICQRPESGSTPAPPPPPPPPPLRSTCPPSWQPYGAGRCLRLLTKKQTWLQARQACRLLSNDTDLLTVPSAVHQAFLTSAVRISTEDVWLGLTYAGADQDGGQFLTWTDEAAVNFTAWGTARPAAPCPNCPVTCGAAGGGLSAKPALWSTVDCEHQLPSLCQRPATPSNAIESGSVSLCAGTLSDYTSVDHVCYKINHDEVSWSDAAAACQRDSTALAYIGDMYDNARLVQQLSRNGRRSPLYWIGVSDTARYGVMQWVSPWPLVPRFTAWDPAHGQLPVRSSCGALHVPSGRWWYQDCAAARRPFVCMVSRELRAVFLPTEGCPAAAHWVGNELHCYQLVTKSRLSWDGARQACEALGYQLAAVTSVEDFDAVRKLIKIHAGGDEPVSASGDVWIGLRSTGDGYRWTNGSRTQYSAWYSSPPAPQGPGCGAALSLADGYWVKASCDAEKPFVCMTDYKKGNAAARTGTQPGGWSAAGQLLLVLVLVAVVASVVAGVILMRRRRPGWLPGWLPRWLTSARPATHHSVENLSYHCRNTALEPGRIEGTLENGTLDQSATHRSGSQDRLVSDVLL